MLIIKLHFLTYHRPLRAHAEHYEDLACADDRMLCKVSRLVASSTLQENSYKSGREELAHPNNRHHIQSKHYHFYLKLHLILRDYPRQLLRIYLHALSFRNLYA